MTSLTVMEIRENGIGSNFKVLNPEDGYRKDNRLWFGTCDECGERISNSSFKGVWQHTVYTQKGYYSMEGYERGIYNQASSFSVDYCPTAKGETNPCDTWVLVDGEKVAV
jgi:hypothetical protein